MVLPEIYELAYREPILLVQHRQASRHALGECSRTTRGAALPEEAAFLEEVVLQGAVVLRVEEELLVEGATLGFLRNNRHPAHDAVSRLASASRVLKYPHLALGAASSRASATRVEDREVQAAKGVLAHDVDRIRVSVAREAARCRTRSSLLPLLAPPAQWANSGGSVRSVQSSVLP